MGVGTIVKELEQEANVLVTKGEEELKVVVADIIAEFAKLRTEFDKLVARIEGHNNSGTPFPIK